MRGGQIMNLVLNISSVNVPAGDPNGDILQTGGNMGLKLEREVRDGEDLGVIYKEGRMEANRIKKVTKEEGLHIKRREQRTESQGASTPREEEEEEELINGIAKKQTPLKENQEKRENPKRGSSHQYQTAQKGQATERSKRRRDKQPSGLASMGVTGDLEENPSVKQWRQSPDGKGSRGKE